MCKKTLFGKSKNHWIGHGANNENTKKHIECSKAIIHVEKRSLNRT